MTMEQNIELARLIILIVSGAAIPIVIFIIGNRFTKTREIEEKLRSDRIDIYLKILEPFMLLFSTEEIIKSSKRSVRGKTNVELASEKLLTLEYQEYAFKLSLIGSDSVVKAFNNLLQAFFKSAKSDEEDSGVALIHYMAILLLEIRKSLGNESTKIHALEMLEWKITDMRAYKADGKYPDLKRLYKDG